MFQKYYRPLTKNLFDSLQICALYVAGNHVTEKWSKNWIEILICYINNKYGCTNVLQTFDSCKAFVITQVIMYIVVPSDQYFRLKVEAFSRTKGISLKAIKYME